MKTWTCCDVTSRSAGALNVAPYHAYPFALIPCDCQHFFALTESQLVAPQKSRDFE